MGRDDQESSSNRQPDGAGERAGFAAGRNGLLAPDQETALAELYVQERWSGRLKDAATFVKSHARAFAQAYLREHQNELSQAYLARQYAGDHALEQSYVDQYGEQLAQNYVLEHPVELAQKYVLGHKLEQPAEYLEANQIALALSYVDEHGFELAEKFVAEYGVDSLPAVQAQERYAYSTFVAGVAGFSEAAAEDATSRQADPPPADQTGSALFDLSQLASIPGTSRGGPPLTGQYFESREQQRVAWENAPPIPLSGDTYDASYGGDFGFAAAPAGLETDYAGQVQSFMSSMSSGLGATGHDGNKTLAGAVPSGRGRLAKAAAGSEVTSAWF